MIALSCFFIQLFSIVISVPPDVCFSDFRWDDCGKKPTPVMYYYKPGSRCEIGIWRGCLPNLNMFEDEYHCLKTCIFSERASPDKYHQLFNFNMIDGDEVSEQTTGTANETTTNGNANTGTELTGTEPTGTESTGAGETQTTVVEQEGGGGENANEQPSTEATENKGEEQVPAAS